MVKKDIEENVDIYSFITSEEIREYFRKNREFTIQEKLRIILTSWKPFTEKMEAISRLKKEVTGHAATADTTFPNNCAREQLYRSGRALPYLTVRDFTVHQVS